MVFDAERMLRALVRKSFEALVLVTPILALPWTVDPLDVNKQTFFFIIVAVMCVAWLGEALYSRRIVLRADILWLPFLVCILCIAVSAGISHEAYTSLFGQANQEYTSAVTFALMLGMAGVGAHVLDNRGQHRVLLFSLIGSSIVGLCAMAAFFGVTFGRLPTNVVGTPNALIVYLLAMTILGCGALIVSDASHKRSERMVLNIATVVTTITTVVSLLAIDYSVLWGLALFGSVSLFALAAVRSELLIRPGRYILPMLLCVSSLFFLVLPSVIASPFPTEVSLSTKSTWDVTTAAWSNGAWAFGTGPGTFAMTFARYHSADLNSSGFWDTRFDRGSSAVLTMFSTLGILGTLALIASLFFLGFRMLRAYAKNVPSEMLPIAAAWMVLVAALFVYPQNFTLMTMLWVLTALVLRSALSSGKTLAFERSPRAGFGAAFAFVLCAVFVLTVAFSTISRYRAEVAFAQAVTIDHQGGDIDDVIARLDTAATANRWSDLYYRNLGSALLHKVITVAQGAHADPELVKSFIGAAVNAGVRATDLGPTNVTNWELRGDIYREVSPLITDAAQFAIASYDQAIALAPNNPRYRVDSSRGYLALADLLAPMVKGDDVDVAKQAKTAQDIALQSANDSLMKAIELKSDYAEARYYLAFVQERQGKLAEAVASMEIVRGSAPSDVGVGLQLALLYLRQGKNDVAKQELERIIAISPNFANAHWYLASVLEQEKNIDGAIIELETIAKLDPANETVQKKIDELKAGKKAATPIPDPLPTEESSTLPDAPVTP
ncbi:MAG: tetratricopeptide repeat protein [Patescibacteria group bacterium]